MVDHKTAQLLLSMNKIAIAVSGGSDSMALLYWCRQNLPLDKFYVINVEHGIRGQESLNDSAFVSNYCIQNNIEFVSRTVNAPRYALEKSMTLEQAARALRYDLFAIEATTTADAILTAHHSSDLAESVLMHISRGSGMGGLIGMDLINGHIIRPLLGTSKAEIMQYIADNNIPYCNDSTNNDNNYTRNYLRNVAIPTLQKVYPAVESNLIKLSERAKEIVDLLDSISPQLEVTAGVIELNLNDMLPALAKHVILKACFLLAVDKDIETRHLEDIMQLSSAQNGARLDLPHRLKAFKEGDKVILTTNQITDGSEYPLNIGIFPFCNGDLLICQAQPDSPIKSLIDADKLPPNCLIRTKRQCDKIKLSYGSKTIGDYFTDTKTPKRLRDTIPLIAMDNTVIAIADQAVNIDYAPTESSKNLMEIKYISKDKIYE